MLSYSFFKEKQSHNLSSFLRKSPQNFIQKQKSLCRSKSISKGFGFFPVLSLTQCLRLLSQVFATYPNEDYDRRNEDVDPMAASAEYELEKRVERLDLFPVELEKGTESYKSAHPSVFAQNPARTKLCMNKKVFI